MKKLTFLAILLSFISCDGPTSPSKGITVLSPNGGEVFHAGAAYIIKWTAVDIRNVDISIVRVDSGRDRNILVALETPARSGEFAWYIPSDIYGGPAGAYKLLIEDSSCTFRNPPPPGGTCGSYRDESDGAFYIAL